jgi:hypothetical protein
MSMEVVLLQSFSLNFACYNIYNIFFKLQSFLENDNFISKSTKVKEKIGLSMAKNSKKIKM